MSLDNVAMIKFEYVFGENFEHEITAFLPVPYNPNNDYVRTIYTEDVLSKENDETYSFYGLLAKIDREEKFDNGKKLIVVRLNIGSFEDLDNPIRHSNLIYKLITHLREDNWLINTNDLEFFDIYCKYYGTINRTKANLKKAIDNIKVKRARAEKKALDNLAKKPIKSRAKKAVPVNGDNVPKGAIKLRPKTVGGKTSLVDQIQDIDKPVEAEVKE